ncbi:glycosyl hydrolase family 8 [Nocardioides kribbensis]|uniref:Glycosyl hydrolase family 8 n=1 Tax=Nocardioides kribbensis TaxID=305517 RepID=A0ABV1NXJ1_9ACTN
MDGGVAPAEPPRTGRRRTLRLLGLCCATALVVALVATTLVLVLRPTGNERGPEGPRADVDARAFLETYVEPDGRVARTDQGGDTVSEGQAYAMLLAVATGDRVTFDRVWDWTREELMTAEGLLSWRWADGAVVDASPAADADLDAARALVTAGRTFDEADYTEAGLRLGTAVLDHETVRTPAGLVLVAGPWATRGSPYVFNPSYVSPVATGLLDAASDDPRWEELTAGSRAALEGLTFGGRLPPDWAEVSSDGSVRATGSPSGGGPQFGYDAARVLARHAESCDPDDRAIAARAADRLGPELDVDVLALSGEPLSRFTSPVMLVARAGADAASGDPAAARAALAAADTAAAAAPTYYGDAWAALGPLMLATTTLGACPAVPAA